MAFVLLSGCHPEISTATLPAPQVWRVQVTPALRWLGPVFNQCTLQAPQTSLLYSELPQPSLNPVQADFTLSLQPANGAVYSAVLGQVGLALVVNPANPLTQLNASEVQSILTGVFANWPELPPADCAGCARPPKGVIQPYIYPAGDDVGRLVQDLFPAQVEKLAGAILAPDPAAVRQAVAADPGGIGFLPAPWLDSSVRSVKIVGIPAEKLQIPIIFSASAEPQAEKRSWLLCVQASLNK